MEKPKPKPTDDIERAYGLFGAAAFWEAFNQDPEAFDLNDANVVEKIVNGYDPTDEGADRELMSPSLLEKMRREKENCPNIEICEETEVYQIWLRRKQSGCTGNISIHSLPSLSHVRAQRANAGKAAKQKAQASGGVQSVAAAGEEAAGEEAAGKEAAGGTEGVLGHEMVAESEEQRNRRKTEE